MGNPEDWVNVGIGDMTCPIGIDLASESGVCDGKAYIGEIQNGAFPYTYDWNGLGSFVSDTIFNGLCIGNNFVVIKDQNNFLKTCAFVMGSLDNGYFPPIQPSDTVIHTYTEFCIDSSVDFIDVIGSEVIDSVTISILWSFYSDSVLIDQLLDTLHINTPNGTYSNIQIYLHLVCDSDTLKAALSVYSTYGYLSLPFTEVGFLNINEWNDEVSFIVYPNPFDHHLNIETNVSEVENITVLNYLGQEVDVKVNAINDTHFIIDFSDVSKGNYIVKMITKDKTLHFKKVIKN